MLKLKAIFMLKLKAIFMPKLKAIFMPKLKAILMPKIQGLGNGLLPPFNEDVHIRASINDAYSTHYGLLICNLTHDFWNHGVNVSPVSRPTKQLKYTFGNEK